MPGLPAVGELTYNGYTFDGATHIDVASEPVRDEADRTVVYKRITITVDAIVTASTAGAATDSTLEDIHVRLSHDGQKLVFKNKGFDRNLTVNAGKVRDVMFGPKVGVLQWKAVGRSEAANVKWQVITCVAACGAQGKHTGLMTINYEADYTIGPRGETTRVLSGYIQIAQTRVRMKIPDSADGYR